MVDVHKPKKSKSVAKSTEASRRREEYTRSKLQGSSTEKSTLRIKRTTRSQAARDKQLASGTSVGNNGQQATAGDQQTAGRDRKTRSRRQQSEIDEKPVSDSTRNKRNHRHQIPDPSTNEPLRRSLRIAESSNRKAVLVLDTSGYPEESSTDLNQAFVDSTFNESKQEANGSVDHEKSTSRKRKVRRQSSVVKSNKSRVRTKRGGHKSRKDRSIDT